MQKMLERKLLQEERNYQMNRLIAIVLLLELYLWRNYRNNYDILSIRRFRRIKIGRVLKSFYLDMRCLLFLCMTDFRFLGKENIRLWSIFDMPRYSHKRKALIYRPNRIMM